MRWFGAAVVTCSVLMWGCVPGVQGPFGSIQVCRTHAECPVGKACIEQICTTGDPDEHRRMIGGDLRGTDFKGKDGDDPKARPQRRAPKPSGPMVFAGRVDGGEPSPPERLASTQAPDVDNGRSPDARPRRVPPPQRPPEPPTPRDDVDPKDLPASQCKSGEKRPCYPDDTHGCSLRDGRCIAPCALGHQLCVKGRWDKTCREARTPKDDKDCRQTRACEGRSPEHCP